MNDTVYHALLNELQKGAHMRSDFRQLAQRLLAQQPQMADALVELGDYALAEDKPDLAALLFRKALETDSSSFRAHEALAHLLEAQGHTLQALKHYQKALDSQPHANIYCAIGHLLDTAKQWGAAMNAYQYALQLDDTHSQSWNGLGILYAKQGQHIQAFQCYQKALTYNPQQADIYHHLGLVLMAQSEYQAALQCYEEALRLDSDLWPVWNSKGKCYFIQGQFAAALDCYEKVLQWAPNDHDAIQYVARIYFEQGQIEKAVPLLQSLLDEQLPLEIRQGVYDTLLFFLRTDPACSNQALFQACREWGQQCAEKDYPRQAVTFSQTRHLSRPLKVGYVSPDFRGHSAASMYGLLVANHDPQQVELFAYAEVVQPDEVTTHLQTFFPHWCSTIDLDDAALAQRIRHDQIDILVDLAGHTAGNRLLVFARQPAPIQVTGFGFTATSGLKTMHYRFTDAYLTPDEETPWHTERLIYLSGLPRWSVPNVDLPQTPLPALHKGYITFGCGNQLFKINAHVIALWADILRAVPHSQLHLKATAFGDTSTQQYVRHAFSTLGIAPERLTFSGASSWPEHMAFYQQLDIALDPFPYNGGVTTAESLWSGLPVIVLNQGTRASASVLAAVGLDTYFLAQTPHEYVQKAVSLAHDLPQLVTWRSVLREQVTQSQLCDGKQFAQEIEHSYRQLWQTWCQQQ